MPLGLGEYVQVFRGMFVKLGITGKESSAFGSFAFPFGEGKRGGGLCSSMAQSKCFKFNFYFLGRGHFKYLYLCGGTPKIIKILVLVPQIIDSSNPPGIFFWKKPWEDNELIDWCLTPTLSIFQLYHDANKFCYIMSWKLMPDTHNLFDTENYG